MGLDEVGGQEAIVVLDGDFIGVDVSRTPWPILIGSKPALTNAGTTAPRSGSERRPSSAPTAATCSGASRPPCGARRASTVGESGLQDASQRRRSSVARASARETNRCAAERIGTGTNRRQHRPALVVPLVGDVPTVGAGSSLTSTDTPRAPRTSSNAVSSTVALAAWIASSDSSATRAYRDEEPLVDPVPEILAQPITVGHASATRRSARPTDFAQPSTNSSASVRRSWPSTATANNVAGQSRRSVHPGAGSMQRPAQRPVVAGGGRVGVRSGRPYTTPVGGGLIGHRIEGVGAERARLTGRSGATLSRSTRARSSRCAAPGRPPCHSRNAVGAPRGRPDIDR